ncbi:MAG: hypothetical protein IKI04_01735, partial [Bacilli bacterium]|nr:hypothetical protein [Bacilli bacterium]
MKKIIDKIKNISFKTFMIVIIIATIVIFVIALILHFENKHKEYMLDTMYDVYPSNVKELYRYLVDANCTGDIKFNLELDSDSVLVNNLDKVDLMDYLFNYLEKRGYLQDSIDIKNINEAIDLLFIDKIDLLKGMESYDYDGYTYMFKDNKVT